MLTPQGTAYSYRFDGRRLAVRAARGTREPNRRELLVAGGTPSRRDQTSCATWSRKSNRFAQPGLAVRVQDRRGRVRAITLTQNIIFGYRDHLNVVTWDTSRRGDPWRMVAQFDLSDVFIKRDGRLRPLPWRACLRAEGRRVSFLAWPVGRVEPPSWNDPSAVHRARLPRGWAYRGRPGWYVGHVPPRGTMVYRNLTTR